MWVVPSIFELFGGKGAILSAAVARVEVALQYPIALNDLTWSNNYEPNQSQMNENNTAAEHYLLCSVAMSWQREGQCMADTTPSRTRDHPLRVPWLDAGLVAEFRKSNAQYIFALRRLEWRLMNWGFACIFLPTSSWCWEIPLAGRLLKSVGVFVSIPCQRSRNEEDEKAALVRNCPALHAAIHNSSLASPLWGEMINSNHKENPKQGGVDDVSNNMLSLGFCKA